MARNKPSRRHGVGTNGVPEAADFPKAYLRKEPQPPTPQPGIHYVKKLLQRSSENSRGPKDTYVYIALAALKLPPAIDTTAELRAHRLKMAALKEPRTRVRLLPHELARITMQGSG